MTPPKRDITSGPEVDNPYYQDPTELTSRAVSDATAQWRLDLRSQRELLETRLASMDKATQLHAEFAAGISKKASDDIAALSAQLTRQFTTLTEHVENLARSEREFLLTQIALVGAETKRVADVTLEKFAAIDGTFSSNALALTAALAAQKEAASETNKSNTLAISKSEQATKETILANQAQSTVVSNSQGAILTDLKDRVVRLETGGVVSATSRSEHRLDIGSIVSMISLLVAITVALVIALKH